MRRGDNWTDPGTGESCFWSDWVGSLREMCGGCMKHIGEHFGGTEYRCEARADGTAPGNASIIGRRCDVWYTDHTENRPNYVLRVGRVYGIYLDGRVRVELPWGQIVTVTAQEVTVFE
jgi:hypothetical protein